MHRCHRTMCVCVYARAHYRNSGLGGETITPEDLHKQTTVTLGPPAPTNKEPQAPSGLTGDQKNLH